MFLYKQIEMEILHFNICNKGQISPDIPHIYINATGVEILAAHNCLGLVFRAYITSSMIAIEKCHLELL